MVLDESPGLMSIATDSTSGVFLIPSAAIVSAEELSVNGRPSVALVILSVQRRPVKLP